MVDTQPISVRLSPEVDSSVRRLARRTRRPLGQVINELLDLSLRAQRFPGVVFVESPTGPSAHIAGSGLDVWELVSLVRTYERTDGSIERLLRDHPHLTARDVDTARAYAAAYSNEIEEAIQDNERPIEDRLRESALIKRLAV